MKQTKLIQTPRRTFHNWHQQGDSRFGNEDLSNHPKPQLSSWDQKIIKFSGKARVPIQITPLKNMFFTDNPEN